MGSRLARTVSLAALAVCLGPSSAVALPSEAPDSSAFVPNSDVFAIARSGGLTYIGGAFTQLTRQTGGAAQLDSGDAQVLNPSPVVDGTVHAVAADGSGGYYLGGNFDDVGGVPRSGLAHVLADGSVDPDFDPAPDGVVRTIAVSGSDVYVGGEFGNVGGQARNRIAKLSAASGNAFSLWNPDANDTVNALAINGTALYVGGEFDDNGAGEISIGGQSRNRIAKLATASGNAFSAFDPDANLGVFALAVSGNDVYAGGAFNNIDGQARAGLAKLDGTNGTAAGGWNPDPNGNVSALALSGGALFAGGTFSAIGGHTRPKIAKVATASGNVFQTFDAGAATNNTVSALAVSGGAVYAAGSFTSIGGEARNRLGKLSATSGSAFSLWDANVQGAGFGFAVAVSGGEVYAGGSFGDMNTVARDRIAALDSDGVPTDFDPTADDTVHAIAVSGDDVYAGGDFSNIGGEARDRVAKLFGPTGNAFTSWDPGDVTAPAATPAADPQVRAIAVSGSDLFVGGLFGTIGGLERPFLAKLSSSSGNAFSTWAGGTGGASNQVFALALSGTDLYVGGPGGIGNPERNYLNKLYTPTGNAFSSFDAGVVGGEVDALAVSGTDLYVGGQFSGIGGDATRSHIAQLYTATGNAFSSFDPGEVSGGSVFTSVAALGVSGSDVYAGGRFSQIGGAARNNLAALFEGSGNAFSSFDPDMDNHVRGLAADAGGVYVGGAFTQVGGRSRAFYAQFTGP